MAIRLSEAEASRLGVRVRDLKPRKVRVPHADYTAGLRTQLRALGLPQGQPEYLFHEKRKWRYDVGLEEARILIDIDGGSWMKDGQGKSHTSGKNFERDRVKDCEAVVRGWRVLRFTPEMVKSGAAVGYIAQLLGVPLQKKTT